MLFFSALTNFFLATVSVRAELTVSLRQLHDETIRATVTNHGGRDVSLLREPNTILMDLPTHKFTFEALDGTTPPTFTGAQVKWDAYAAKNVPEAYAIIPAYGSVSFDHDLSKAYNFAHKGETAQEFTLSLFQPSFTAGTKQIRFSPPTTKVTISPRKQSLNSTFQQVFNSEQYMRGCYGTQLVTLSLLSFKAEEIISGARQYLHDHESGTDRYTTWFGEYTRARHSVILIRFDELARMDYPTFDCSTCSDRRDIVAYVYPTQPERGIFLCRPFWTTPATGADSQVGTLINQASRFIEYGGTEEIVTGQSKCKQLAKENPKQAIKNADSLEYFAENTPPLK